MLNDLYIIIAEDDEDDGDLLCESFENHKSFGKVTWVKNGKVLMESLQNSDGKIPDLILTDINMPIMNGLEAAEEILKHPDYNKIPIIVYSSANNPYYESKCKELGCLAFLVKPYKLPEYEEIPSKLISILRENR